MRHTEPDYIEISPSLRERLEKFRDEHTGEALGEVAQTILWEDDQVRIWEMKLEPGEHHDFHRHDHDYYLVIFSGDYVAGVPPKDSGTDFFAVRLPPEGNTLQIPKGGVEWAFNIGDQTYHEILIELKNS